MPLILGTNSIKASGFDVDNSVRLDNNAYFNRTFDHAGAGGGGGTFKWTLSLWFKRSLIDGNEHVLMSRYVNANKYVTIKINGNNKIEYRVYNFADQCRLTTTAVFRDVAAWTHFVIAQDTTGGTAGDRTKFFVNGSRVTAFDTQTNFDQNVGGDFNTNSAPHQIGAYNGGDEFQGYFAQVCFVDNVQYDADQFGEFDSDSGIWKPIDVSGLSTGATSFFLDFADSGDLGDDESGESNDFTENNLAATDQSTDTCTNNSCTMNPLNMPISNQPTFSEGNLKTVTSSSGSGRFGGTSTFGVTQGKWYIEAKATVGSTYSRNSIGVSYNPSEMARNNSDNTLTNTTYAWGWDSSGGDVYHDSSVVVNYATYTTGDICQIFLDLDNHKLYYGKNGTLQSSTGITLDTGETYFIAQIDRTGTSEVSTFEFNFGSPIYAISSSNTDGEYGNFEYSTTITGDGASKTFKALNTKNLAEYG